MIERAIMANQSSIEDWQSRVDEIQTIKLAVNEDGKQYKKEKAMAEAYRISMKEDERFDKFNLLLLLLWDEKLFNLEFLQ